MKIYLIERIGETDWDEYNGFCFCAENEKEARLAASKFNPHYVRRPGHRHLVKENNPLWKDLSKSTCSEINPEDYTNGQLILSSFNAG